MKYINLTNQQIETLTKQGCTAEDWSKVAVAEGFDTSRLVNVSFCGSVQLGDLTGTIEDVNGTAKNCGIYNATLIDCTVGNNCRIANIGVHIANYEIADNVCIENVGTMQTNAGATFGNGVECDVLNEAGGREVVLFDKLNVQIAYMMCLHRYQPAVVDALKKMAKDYAESVKSDTGKVASGAKICSTAEIIDVNVGANAVINGASSLVNGTILSAEDAPTLVGCKVVADNFIIAEGAKVTTGANLGNVFVGQGCQVGKQYSAENSLFFANSEAFHGEACSIFAGPYTVTHHKSTLLIAGLFSFYNAGSGTNQSNHMYKLGPCHEGKLGRGTKTGSFSYMMWPCKTGPFSVVLGKHTGTFDTSDYPFSHIEARPNGKATMIPGLHLTTVGTVRDGAKWPARDRRKGAVKRDFITFDVFSPYTVGKMIKATDQLKEIHSQTDKSIEETSVGGALVRRPILRTAQKYYRTGIEMYLQEKVFARAQQALKAGSLDGAFKADDNAVYSFEWIDLGGQMMPKARLDALHKDIESGKLATIEDVYKALEEIFNNYQIDEWAWVLEAYKKVFDVDLTSAGKEELVKTAEGLLKVKTKFLNLVIADADKEFAELSRTGFGQDGTAEDRDKDFEAVRGTFDDNKFVKDMRKAVEQLKQDVEEFINALK